MTWTAPREAASGPAPGRPVRSATMGARTLALKTARNLGKRDHKLGIAGDQEPARRARGRHRDRQGRRPRRRPEREARDHGPERLRQVDARLRPDGPPGLRDHARARSCSTARTSSSAAPTSARRRASSSPSSTRTRSRRDGHQLPPQRDQRDPQGARRRRGRPDPGEGVPHGDPRRDGAAEGAARARLALSQRRVLRRREEARRDPADGDAAAADRDPRRDRLRPRHRRAADRRQRRQRARRRRDGRARDHALPAHPQLRHAGPRARLRRRHGSSRAAARSSRTSSRPRATMPSSRRKRGSQHEHDRDRRRQGDPRRVPVRLLQLGRGGELLLQVRPRPLARARRGDLRAQERARLDARSSGTRALDYFLARPLPTWGGNLGEIDFDNIYYYIKPTEKQGTTVGGPAGRHQGHLRQARHPRGREEVPRRRRRPVRVGGRLPQAPGGPREAGRDLPRHGLGACASTRTSSSSTSARSSRRTTTSSPR